MKIVSTLCCLFAFFALQCQTYQVPEDYGCYRLPFVYENDTVDVLIRSHLKDYKRKKPLLLFVQGSMPQPLLKYNENGRLNTFPFDEDLFVEDYHLAIIGKPGVPLITKLDELTPPHYVYKDPKTGAFPRKYCQNNHLAYYVNRNKAVLEFLAKQDFIDERKIVVVGHSEGVSIGFKMAVEKAKMTHLVLLNAGLAGRIMSIITNSRTHEKTEADFQKTEAFFNYWKYLANKTGEFSDDCSKRDSHKATSSFSYPYRQHLSEIDLPIFFGYGTKDESVLLMDYLRVQAIQQHKDNFHFKAYFGLEHNFFGFNVADGLVNYEDYQFDKVASDFKEWLTEK